MHRLVSTAFLGLCLLGGNVWAAGKFSAQSADIENGKALKSGQVYKGFGCDGGNQSPQVSWSNAPAGTKSFAVTMYDPDAPTGSGWWHWVVYNIPASVSKLDSGASSGKLPEGAKQGRNDYGSHDFGGACPPPGDKPHRYIVTVHALKVESLDVPQDASPAMIGFMINSNRMGSASFTGKYGR